MNRIKRIVVGVDGSASSLEALRWAAEEARIRDVPLRVVTAWMFPPFSALPGTSAPPTARQLTHEAGKVINDALTHVDSLLDGVEVERFVTEGDPASAILRCIEPDDLLVLGARGIGGIRRLLLGSVSRRCSEHATCPVVIIHSQAQAA